MVRGVPLFLTLPGEFQPKLKNRSLAMKNPINKNTTKGKSLRKSSTSVPDQPEAARTRIDLERVSSTATLPPSPQATPSPTQSPSLVLTGDGRVEVDRQSLKRTASEQIMERG